MNVFQDSSGHEDRSHLHVTSLLEYLLAEISNIRKNQESITHRLKSIEHDQSVWNENTNTRERCRQQQETIDRILRFLANVFTSEKIEGISRPDMDSLQTTNIKKRRLLIKRIMKQKIKKNL